MPLAHKSLACPISTKEDQNDLSCSKIKTTTQARVPPARGLQLLQLAKISDSPESALREDCNFVFFLQVSDALNPDRKTFI